MAGMVYSYFAFRSNTHKQSFFAEEGGSELGGRTG